MLNILVTGGLGFIGSHTCVQLLENKYKIIIIDNLINSKLSVKNKIEEITKNINKNIDFYNVDITEKKNLENIFIKYNFDLLIHFAGLKSVNQSINNPLDYYNNNVVGSINLFDLCDKYNVNNIIFSSSATVYGKNNYPVDENATIGQGITNPYGQTKYIVECILQDIYKSDKSKSITVLRYFNPVGAHKSGLIGEDPNDIPNNLFPHILKQKLTIFGNNYNTKDGTCVRDFIHVVDLAKGHVKAMKNMTNYKNKGGYYVYNLGSGKGISVLEFIKEFEKINSVKINYTFGKKREGDLENVYAITDRAYNELGWKTEKTLQDICKDGYNYFKINKL